MELQHRKNKECFQVSSYQAGRRPKLFTLDPWRHYSGQCTKRSDHSKLATAFTKVVRAPLCPTYITCLTFTKGNTKAVNRLS